MAARTWIVSLFRAAAAALLSTASPDPRSAQVVHPGQNVSLSCNSTSSSTVTWYLLRSDLLLPLLTVESTKVKGEAVNFHSSDRGRVHSTGSPEDGQVGLDILQVVEEDAGIYFCSWQCDGKVFVSRGIHLSVRGAEPGERGETAGWPCWTLEICILPALLVSCVTFMVGLCVSSGKPAPVCCYRSKHSPGTAEDASLHYSSLRHTKQLQPPDQGRGGRGRGRGRGIGLAKEEVMYSTVASRKTPHGSHDC